MTENIALKLIETEQEFILSGWQSWQKLNETALKAYVDKEYPDGFKDWLLAGLEVAKELCRKD